MLGGPQIPSGAAQVRPKCLTGQRIVRDVSSGRWVARLPMTDSFQVFGSEGADCETVELALGEARECAELRADRILLRTGIPAEQVMFVADEHEARNGCWGGPSGCGRSGRAARPDLTAHRRSGASLPTAGTPRARKHFKLRAIRARQRRAPCLATPDSDPATAQAPRAPTPAPARRRAPEPAAIAPRQSSAPTPSLSSRALQRPPSWRLRNNSPAETLASACQYVRPGQTVRPGHPGGARAILRHGRAIHRGRRGRGMKGTRGVTASRARGWRTAAWAGRARRATCRSRPAGARP